MAGLLRSSTSGVPETEAGNSGNGGSQVPTSRKFVFSVDQSNVKLLIPLTVLGMTTFGLGGRQPLVLAAAVVLALFGFCFNTPPVRKALMVLWYLGCLVVLWHLITLLPLPISGLDAKRQAYFSKAHTIIASLAAATLPADAPPAPSTKENNEEAAAPGTPPESLAAEWGRLSLNAAGTQRFLIVFAGAWAMFWCSTAMGNTQRLRFLGLLVTGGALVAVLGLLGRYVISPGNRVWWLFPVGHPVAGGPFINRNHFASFCALLVPAAVSLTLSPVSWYRSWSESSGNSNGRHRSDSNSPAAWRWFYGICLMFLALTPILYMSRGGIIMMLVGALVTCIFWVQGRPLLALASTVIGIGLIFAFLFWPSAEFQERMGTLHDLRTASPLRLQMTREALRQWRDYPYFGAGADSFRTLNGVYRLGSATRSPLYCENEYAQLLADHGLIGAVLAGALLLVFGVGIWSNFHAYYNRTRSFRALRGVWADNHAIMKRHREFYPPTVALPVLATASGVGVGMLFHFACDFPCRVPLNAFLTAALLGLAMPLPRQPTTIRRKYWRWPQLVFAAAVLAMIALWHGPRLQLDEPDYLASADTTELQAALTGAPSYWVPWVKLAEKTRTKALAEAERQLQGEELTHQAEFDPFALYELSLDCLQTGLARNPQDPRLWTAWAQALRQFGDQNPEAIQVALRKAAVLTPNRHEPWNQWLKFVLKQNDPQTVAEAAQTIITFATPTVAEKSLHQLFQWADKNRYAEIKHQTIMNMLVLKPRSVKWWKEKAAMEKATDDLSAAVESLQKTVDIEPNKWQNWMLLGQACLDSHQENRANRAFTEAMRLHPEIREEVEKSWRQARRP